MLTGPRSRILTYDCLSLRIFGFSQIYRLTRFIMIVIAGWAFEKGRQLLRNICEKSSICFTMRRTFVMLMNDVLLLKQQKLRCRIELSFGFLNNLILLKYIFKLL